MVAISKRILVIGPAWLGDMVLTQSLYKSLKHRDLAVKIDVVAPSYSKALLRRMPEVSRVIEMPAGHGELSLRTRYRLGKKLRAQGYRQAIILPRSLKSALLPWFAAVPVRTGFCGEMRYGLINDMRPLDKQVMPGIVTRFVFLGQLPGTSSYDVDTPAPALAVDKDNRAACLERIGLKRDGRLLALMPGAAFGPAKRWPPEYFAEVARRYADDGWRIWIFGSAADRACGAQIENVVRTAVNLCGRTTLEDVIDLFSFADLAVTNDSGLMHVAAAVGCPLVAIYGMSSPAYTPPMIARSKCLWRNLDCSPCWKRTCRYGHYRCLNEISPDQVCAEADAL